MQHFAFFNSRHEAPIILSSPCSRPSLLHIRFASSRYLINLLFSGGVLNCEGLSRKAVHKFAINAHPAHFFFLLSLHTSSNRSSARSISSLVIIKGGSIRITSGLFKV